MYRNNIFCFLGFHKWIYIRAYPIGIFYFYAIVKRCKICGIIKCYYSRKTDEFINILNSMQSTDTDILD